MWYLLQSLIIFAVMASNTHWQWTPNGMVAAMIGTGAALLVTVGLSHLIEMVRRLLTNVVAWLVDFNWLAVG